MRTKNEFAVLRIDPSSRKRATRQGEQGQNNSYLLSTTYDLSQDFGDFFAPLHEIIRGNAKNLPRQSAIAADASLIHTP
ncbi:MAG: hypothetical protein RKO66_08190 [Candidatus Contendobacter sp.]|nr:hypothetical protein [Candidatus Contendobacter sp.]MDS4057770.1 hypothetical protein [Candidatus Contendobacter sp.]